METCLWKSSSKMAENLPQFRREFKRYKQRKPPPDFSDVIDFERELTWRGRVKNCSVSAEAGSRCDTAQLGLNDLETWKCYELESYEGFRVIVNPFTTSGQRQWVEKCVGFYPGKPNVCNLDAHVEREDQNLWKLYEEHCLNLDKCAQPNSKASKTLMDQLRWVTLGYHYDWNTKKYYKENFTPFPCDLGELSKCIAQAMGYPCFTPEAGIINYYHMDSTLSGHTDHSELDLSAPLFSISFGQTCVFLLGGRTLDEAPSAMYLRSGDVVVMSRDTRLAYHAVPRILRHEALAGSLVQSTGREISSERRHTLDCLQKYLNSSRINVNIRQVEGPSGSFASQANTVSNTI